MFTLRPTLLSFSKRSFRSSAALFAEVDAANVLTLNFNVPHKTLYSKTEIYSVVVPGLEGEFSLLGGHVPIVAQLKPGIVQVYREQTSQPESYVISGGFVLSHNNSVTDVIALEAVNVNDLDHKLISDNLVKYAQARDTAAEGTVERALAKIDYDTTDTLAKIVGLQV